MNNIFAGRLMILPIAGRFTPYHFPHSTKVAGLKNTTNGKQWFYNNIFIAPPKGSPKLKVRAAKDKEYGLVLFDRFSFGVRAEGNVYLGAAIPSKLDVNYIRLPDFDAGVELKKKDGKVVLSFKMPEDITKISGSVVTTSLIGKTKISELPIENADGTPLKVDTDYFGEKRKDGKTVPGPFIEIKPGMNEFPVTE